MDTTTGIFQHTAPRHQEQQIQLHQSSNGLYPMASSSSPSPPLTMPTVLDDSAGSCYTSNVPSQHLGLTSTRPSSVLPASSSQFGGISLDEVSLDSANVLYSPHQHNGGGYSPFPVSTTHLGGVPSNAPRMPLFSDPSYPSGTSSFELSLGYSGQARDNSSMGSVLFGTPALNTFSSQNLFGELSEYSSPAVSSQQLNLGIMPATPISAAPFVGNHQSISLGVVTTNGAPLSIYQPGQSLGTISSAPADVLEFSREIHAVDDRRDGVSPYYGATGGVVPQLQSPVSAVVAPAAIKAGGPRRGRTYNGTTEHRYRRKSELMGTELISGAINAPPLATGSNVNSNTGSSSSSSSSAGISGAHRSVSSTLPDNGHAFRYEHVFSINEKVNNPQVPSRRLPGSQISTPMGFGAARSFSIDPSSGLKAKTRRVPSAGMSLRMSACENALGGLIGNVNSSALSLGFESMPQGSQESVDKPLMGIMTYFNPQQAAAELDNIARSIGSAQQQQSAGIYQLHPATETAPIETKPKEGEEEEEEEEEDVKPVSGGSKKRARKDKTAGGGPSGKRARPSKEEASAGHNGEASKCTEIKCEHPDCDKSFTRKYNLTSHERTHTNERPFPCDMCEQRFSRNHDLKRHMKIHTGARPFLCQHCGRGFARADALSRHTSKGNTCKRMPGERPPRMPRQPKDVKPVIEPSTSPELMPLVNTMDLSLAMMEYHQLVSLDISFDERQQQQQQRRRRQLVKGVTELSIRPKTRELKEIRLHCERPVVLSVSVNGLACQFTRTGPTTRQQVLSKLAQTQETDDQGDFLIQFPSEFQVEDNNGSESFKMAKVRIEFYLFDSQTGLVFQQNMAYTETRIHPLSVTRAWLPCIDSMRERSTWDLFFTVPACVEDSEEGGFLPMTVVSVGELTSLVVHPRDPLRKIFRYVMSTATPACVLGFAVGPFTSACTLGSSSLLAVAPEMPAPVEEDEEEEGEGEGEGEGEDEEEGDGDEDEEDSEGEENNTAPVEAPSTTVRPETIDAIGGIYAFAAGGHQDELVNTCSFLPEALGFHSQEFGAYPYRSYKVVFVAGLRVPVVTCASLTLVDASLLHPPTIIDAAYEARRVLGLAVAEQWFGTFVAAADWADQWLVVGLAGYMAGAFVRHSLGHNEHRFRLHRDMQRLCHADVNQRALAAARLGSADFVQLKAPLVLHMLDRRMVKGGSQSLGLARMAAKVLGACVSGDLGPAHQVSTAWFLRGCRRVSGADVTGFAEQWIYGTGCPVFHMAYAFNRKKLAVEITVHQESTNARATAAWAKPQLFRGPLTARIREADGTPYEHVLDVGERVRRFEVQFNTKYKRIRRSTKRFHQRQMAAADAAPLFGAETAAAKQAWRVVEWGEADDESLASATFEWITVDPDLEWACIVHFDQPAFMWAAQLQRDRDVAAQADAVAALRRLPSAAASTALMRAVMDSRVFYRVRVAAALALASFATEKMAWIGMHHLAAIYRARYCVRGFESPDDACVPRANDFSCAGEYFTQRAVLAALSNIRDRRGEAPAPARRLLLAALRYNDNSANAYADGHYLAGLLAANANSVAQSTRFVAGASCAAVMAEVERLRALDVLVPSFHNVVTCAALEALLRVSLVQPRTRVFNAALFAAMAAPQAYAPVRRTAVCGLLLHWGPQDPRVSRLVAAWAGDASHPRLASDVGRHLGQALMLRAMAFGRQHHSLLFMEEEGEAADEHIDTPARLVGGFEALVDDVGDSIGLRTVLASSVYDSALPLGPRRILGSVHALVYQTVDASVPPPPPPPRRRLKIKIQPIKRASPVSSDSEDTPLLGSLVAQEPVKQRRKYQRKIKAAPVPPDEIVAIDDVPPPLAGTRPPPLTVADPSLNSPVYTDSPPATAPSTPIKLKLKLSKVASSAAIDTISKAGSPLAKEISPTIPTPPPPETGAPPPPPPPPETGAPPPPETSAPPPPLPLPEAAALSPATSKLVHRVWRKLSRHPDAFPFMRPVDVVLDGCPTYYDVIKQPMDLGTIKRTLDANGYLSADQFEKDVRLMLDNCFLFNPPGTPVHLMGQAVQKAFDAEWLPKPPKMVAGRMSTGKRKSFQSTPNPVEKPSTTVAEADTAKRAKTELPSWHSLCTRVLQRLQAQPSAIEFMMPVDPIKQGVPTYFDIIKHPIDLSTISSKLGNGSYQSASEFREDVELLFANCFLFNTPGTYVYSQCQTLQSVFGDTWDRLCVPDLVMDDRACERARGVVARLKRDDAAWPFLKPVDPVALGVPTYFDLVRNPMDLSTVHKRLAKRGYKCVAEFVADIQLIIDDCFLFNLPDTPVHECGKALHALANKLLEQDQWNHWLF
ncbi:hypothetical protein GGI20_002167 [Coemansia sp. BCRC 34301]|nr:hypothetical protein GGI20_002167 [Coemansia sp. BCRC 34301]